jgi:hypothetical protein
MSVRRIKDLHLLNVEKDDEFDHHMFVLYFEPKKFNKIK